MTEEKPEGVLNITYDDFCKTDIRVALILEAHEHPNADKLMILKVALEPGVVRQIVAGIRQHYDVASLINKRIIVVTNLEPRNLRGEMSHGMLLAAKDDEGNFGLLTTDKVIHSGSKVG